MNQPVTRTDLAQFRADIEFAFDQRLNRLIRVFVGELKAAERPPVPQPGRS